MSIENAKILIVDDQILNLKAMKTLLKKTGAEILLASSGNEALKLALEHHFAVILLDVQMPGMDGYELAHILNQDPNTSSVPIVFITANYQDEHNVEYGYECGAVDYLLKPVNSVALVSKVNVFLQLNNISNQLKHNQNELEKIVTERTHELASALDREKKVNQAKSEFLANMSHELLTPLHGIISFTQFGSAQIEKKKPDETSSVS